MNSHFRLERPAESFRGFTCSEERMCVAAYSGAERTSSDLGGLVVQGIVRVGLKEEVQETVHDGRDGKNLHVDEPHRAAIDNKSTIPFHSI